MLHFYFCFQSLWPKVNKKMYNLIKINPKRNNVMKLHDPGFTTGWIAIFSANRTSRLASRGLYLCNAIILHSNLAPVVKQAPVRCFKTNLDVSKKDPRLYTRCRFVSRFSEFEAVRQGFAFTKLRGVYCTNGEDSMCSLSKSKLWLNIGSTNMEL